ncbi:MAG: chlorophyll synthesis pathway protein BchC [Pseudomonadota bacterium]
MNTVAIVLQEPKRLSLSRIDLATPGDEDVVVDVDWSGISTGTERLLWSGRMPSFPGMGYPLVPGYESVGGVATAGRRSGLKVGDQVFVPGARCFGPIRGLFGASASRLVVPGSRVVPLDKSLGERGVLLALAATAHHVIEASAALPDLIVGHGVLGRLIARIAVALGQTPTVWERDPLRADGAEGYVVSRPDADAKQDYSSICDVSGDTDLLDTLIGRLAPRGEVVLAGFYSEPLHFVFPPAFMKEARIRVAAEWQPNDLAAVKQLIETEKLSLDGLITHRQPVQQADEAYRTAFSDPSCLKMILDWRANA